MKGVNSGAYIRMPFTVVGDSTALDFLNLNIQYDDGFVAYLNGEEIARRNAPVSPVWNSISNSDLSDSLALVAESFDVSFHLSQLVVGSNVLAIHGLNGGLSAERFLIRPTLSASSVAGTVFFQAQKHLHGFPLEQTELLDFAIQILNRRVQDRCQTSENYFV